MFKRYNEFKKHRYIFNVFFSTTLAILFALAICAFLLIIGALRWERSDTVVIVAILVAIPVVTYLAVSDTIKLKPAYYESWRDRRKGRIDRNAILQQFAKQYKIDNWRTEVFDIKADGRWKFHANTKYMYALARERDHTLNEIHQEYVKKMGEINKKILNGEKEIHGFELKMSAQKEEKERITRKLDSANSPGEIYQQRRNLDEIVKEISNTEQQLNTANYYYLMDKKSKEEIEKTYESICGDIKSFYYSRYSKYMEIAIEKINKVNGLRYVIDDMPSAER